MKRKKLSPADKLMLQEFCSKLPKYVLINSKGEPATYTYLEKISGKKLLEAGIKEDGSGNEILDWRYYHRKVIKPRLSDPYPIMEKALFRKGKRGLELAARRYMEEYEKSREIVKSHSYAKQEQQTP